MACNPCEKTGEYDSSSPTAMFRHYNIISKLPSSQTNANDLTAARLFRSFMNLCLCFGLSQGGALTTVTYATTFFGFRLGSTADGIFFSAFTITSLALATWTVRYIGKLRSYKLALLLFMVYEVMLWFAWGRPTGSASLLALAYSASAIGGFGFALHWTSQSLIFSSTAQAYARARGFEVQTVSNSFSGIFAGIYVLFEMLCKLAASTLVSLSSNIDKHPPWHRFFVLFTIMIFVALINSWKVSNHEERAVVSAASSEKNSLSEESSAPSEPLLSGTNDESPVHNIDSTEQQSTWSSCRNDVYERMISVPRLMVSSPFLCWLMPVNIAFGVTAGFLFSYYYDNTVAAYLGDASVGFVSAISPGTCSMLSLPLAFLAEGFGKSFVIFLGTISLGIIGTLYLFIDNSKLGNWPAVITIQVLMGIGRAVWEGVGKAIYVDVFDENDLAAAFSAMYMVTGMLTFLSLFVFPNVSVKVMAILIIVPALMMVPGYKVVQARSRRTESLKRSDKMLKDHKGMWWSAGPSVSETTPLSPEQPGAGSCESRRDVEQ
jgi:MFS family permease